MPGLLLRDECDRVKRARWSAFSSGHCSIIWRRHRTEKMGGSGLPRHPHRRRHPS